MKNNLLVLSGRGTKWISHLFMADRNHVSNRHLPVVVVVSAQQQLHYNITAKFSHSTTTIEKCHLLNWVQQTIL